MENRLREIIASVFELNSEDIDENTSTDNVAKWDSLHHMNLISALEEEFEIEFEEEEMIELTNYKLIYLTLQEKMN